MKTKRLIVFFVVFGVVALGIAAYFLSRPHEPVSIMPQEFAQVPEQPKLIAELTANYHLTDAIDPMKPEGFRSGIHSKYINSVAFSPVDTSLIASINRNGIINLWDRDNTEAPVKVLSHPEIFSSIGFSPNGKLLASARWKLVLWDVATGKKINTIKTSYNQFAFSPDSKQLATIPEVAKYFRETGVKIWDIQDPKNITEVTTLPFNQSACAVDISSDGKWIAAGYINGTVNVWDLQTKQLVKTLETPLYQMDYLKFSPNNVYMVVGGHSMQMYVNHGEKGYMMWELPGWERKGEVLRGHVENLTFSPDGKICAIANHTLPLFGSGVQLWDIGSGAPITTIRRGTGLASNPSLFYPLETRDVAFSQDGHLVATGSEDGIIRVWELTPQQLEGDTIPADVVRILYLLPKNKTPPDIIDKIDKAIKSVQDLYANEMKRHGFGRKTFTYETDENGTVKVYGIREDQTEIPDLSKDIWIAVRDDTSSISFAYQLHNANANEKFLFPSKKGSKGNISSYDTIGFTHGKLVHASSKDMKRKPLAYTLRGAFGLPYVPLEYEHNVLKRFFKRVNNMMPWTRKWYKLTKCEAEWLDKSRFFNPNQPFFDKRPTIEMTVSSAEDSDTRLFTFSVTDEDGIHQAQLFVPIDMKSQQWRKKFYDCKPLKGKEEATCVFEITDPEIMTVELRMIDMHGNIAHREFIITPETNELTKEP